MEIISCILQNYGDNWSKHIRTYTTTAIMIVDSPSTAIMIVDSPQHSHHDCWLSLGESTIMMAVLVCLLQINDIISIHVQYYNLRRDNVR